jgi:hypothetical protein
MVILSLKASMIYTLFLIVRFTIIRSACCSNLVRIGVLKERRRVTVAAIRGPSSASETPMSFRGLQAEIEVRQRLGHRLIHWMSILDSSEPFRGLQSDFLH